MASETRSKWQQWWDDFRGRSLPYEIGDRDKTYFGQLVERYRALPYMVDNPRAQEVAVAIVGKANTPDSITWTDIDALEIALFSLMPTAMLKREAWILRARYRDMVGQPVYDLYLQSNPLGAGASLARLTTQGPPSGRIALLRSATHVDGQVDSAHVAEVTSLEEDEALRADLLTLLSEIHWLYVYWPMREQIRNQTFSKIVRFMLATIMFAALAYCISLARHSTHLTTITLVALFGIIGGFISTQARLYGMPKGVHLVNLYELRLSPGSIMQAPLSGGIFALVLYLIFMGGLLEGVIFPKMRLMPQPTATTQPNGKKTDTHAMGKAATAEGIVAKADASRAAAAKATAETAAAEKTVVHLTATAKAAMQRASASSGPANHSAVTRALKAMADADAASKISVAKRQAEQTAIANADADRSAVEKASLERTVAENAADRPTPFTWENLDNTEPASIPDFGKLLVWAFIAGFAERFVPDTLQRVIGKANTITEAKRN